MCFESQCRRRKSCVLGSNTGLSGESKPILNAFSDTVAAVRNSFPSDLDGLDSGSLRDAVKGMSSLDNAILKEEAMDFDTQEVPYGT